ncbi:MAG TPA: MoxR family ATPase [Mycobacteriales bacterium]|nr:MoxR family ATPase [Mycobacteriales bacterium]
MSSCTVSAYPREELAISQARAPEPPSRVEAAAAAQALVTNVETVIRGQRQAVESAVIALIAGGHVLLEDVPGVGKTMLGRSLAKSVSGAFKRIQGTPDLLPSDITGSTVYDGQRHAFDFIAGPVFANVVLIDELNRTSPRTQAALMEAMDEGGVTVDGTRHPLPEPFFVVATQNPLEHHGTYPLPEGQLDRFALALEMGYVEARVEREIVQAQLLTHPVDALRPVLTTGDVLVLRGHARATHVSDAVTDYAVALTRGTRGHAQLELGASSRATIALVRSAQARALLAGREFVTPDDVKALAVQVLAHRVLPAMGVEPQRRRAIRAIVDVVSTVPVPMGG